MLSMTVKRGLLIVVEGCDRAGKSTQCERLVDRLKSEGHVARLLKFPGELREDMPCA